MPVISARFLSEPGVFLRAGPRARHGGAVLPQWREKMLKDQMVPVDGLTPL